MRGECDEMRCNTVATLAPPWYAALAQLAARHFAGNPATSAPDNRFIFWGRKMRRVTVKHNLGASNL